MLRATASLVVALLLLLVGISVPVVAQDMTVGFNVVGPRYFNPKTFNDPFKEASDWFLFKPFGSQSQLTPPLAGEWETYILPLLDANLFPTSMPEVDGEDWWLRTFMVSQGTDGHCPQNQTIPPAIEPTTFHYTATWQGCGTMTFESVHHWIAWPSCWQAFAPLPPRTISSTGSCDCTDTFTGTVELVNCGAFFRIEALDATNPVTNLELIPVGREAQNNDDYLDEVKAFDARFTGGYLRFLDAHQDPTADPVEAQYDWADRPQENWWSYGFHTGTDSKFRARLPLEKMVERANTAKMHLWIPFITSLDDDYHTNAAVLVNSLLDPELKMIPEYGNEIWGIHFSGQSAYVHDWAQTQPGLCDPYPGFHLCKMQGQARRQSEICAIWEAEMGDDRVLCVPGAQAANPDTIDQLFQNPADAAAFEGVSGAPYFCQEPADVILTSWIQNGTTPPLWEAMEACASDLYPGSTWYTNSLVGFSNRAATRSLPVYGYEGGQHLTIPLSHHNIVELVEYAKEVQRHPRMARLYRQYLDLLESVGNYETMTLYVGPRWWDKWTWFGMCEWYPDDTSECAKLHGTLSFIEDCGRGL